MHYFKDKYEHLARNVDLFKGLGLDEIVKIMSYGLTKTLDPDSVIFEKGQLGTELYVILEGQVQIVDEGNPIALLGPGDMFGEMAVMGGARRSASAVTTEITNLFVLSEDRLHKLLTKRIAISMLWNVIGTLSQRLATENDKIKRLQGSGQMI